MPQVPQYNGNVQQNAAPVERVPMQAPIEAFGGGEGMTGVAKQAVDLIKKGRDAADKVQILDANTKATELKNKLLHGYTDENGNEVLGALKQQGKNALGLPESVQKQYDEGLQKINESLNDRQQSLFSSVSEEIRLSVDSTVRAHVSNESYKMQIASMNTGIKVSQDDAALNFTDPKLREAALMNIGAVVKAGGKLAGWDDAMIAQVTSEKVSAANKNIVERYLNQGNFSAAEEYFKNNYKSFTGEDQGDVDKLVKAGSQEGKAFQLADELTSSEALKKGMTEKKAILQLREEADPKIRALAERRVEHFFEQQRSAKDESQKNLNVALAKVLRANKGDYGSQEVQNLLRGASMETDKAAQGYAQFVKNGGKSSDPLAYDTIEAKLKSTNPEIRYSVTEAEITDLALPLNETGDRSRETLLKMRSKVQLNDESFQKAIGAYASEDELVKQKLVDMGLDPKSDDAKMMSSRMKAEVRAQEEIDGKPLIREKKMKILDQMTLQDNLGFFGKMIKAGYGASNANLLAGSYRFTTKIADISDDDIEAITKALQGLGHKKPTDDQILRVYNSRKN